MVSVKGVPFLTYLFKGQGRHGAIPARDLCGARQAGIEKMLEALRAWAKDQIRKHWVARAA